MESPFQRSRSVRAHLLALVAVTALPLIALLVHASQHEYRLAVTQGQLRAHTLADATATSSRALISLIHDALDVTATESKGDLLDPKQCAARVSQLNATLRFLPNVMVSRPDGRTLCSSQPLPESGADPVDVSTRDWFVQVMRGASFSVGAPVVGQITGQWVFAVATPVPGADGGVRAVLAASVPLITFQDLLAGVTLGPNDLVTISNVNRIIVARSKDPDLWVGRELPAKLPLHEDRGQGFVGTEAADAEGVNRTWASVEIPEFGWTVHGGIPADEVLAAARANMLRRALLGGATLILVGLLGYLVQARITSSLNHLVRVTGSVAEPETLTVPPGTPTEIAEVARRFNRTLTARLRAEREERRAKERFRSILNNAVLGIYVSTADGSFLEVNPAFASLMGYDDPQALIERGPEALYADPKERGKLIAAYHDGDLVEGIELDWLRKDGTPVTVRLHGKVVSHFSGQRTFEIMVEDVTERRRLEEQLHTTQKMEAVGRLAGGLAHDFNNVLTVIRMNAELADAELGATGPGHGGIEEIIRATEGAQRLTRQLLSFSRRRETEPRLVRLNEVIRGVEKMLARIIGEDIRLEARLTSEVGWVRMDPGHLEQVLMNLAVNARDALPRGGRIVIETSVMDLDFAPPGFAEAEDRKSWVCLAVEDNGVGMPANVRGRIFEPFFTTKAVGQGTGLGLSTAYALVTGAGGHIAVDSTPGKGTRFDIWLPAFAEGPPPQDGARTGPAEMRGGDETILVVEDNAAVRRAVRRTLEGAGYHVITGRDGEEGVEHLHGHPGRIDLVLTDVVMPNMSGPELADHVERVRPTTPILFMSGYTADHPVAERVSRSGVGFIPKPFDVSELLGLVRATLARGPVGFDERGQPGPPSGSAEV